MSDAVVLLVLAGLRERDLAQMPRLQELMREGDLAALAPSFPCLSGPVQANLLTGAAPGRHGIVADQIYLRGASQVEGPQSWHARLEQPPIWDVLRRHQPGASSAVWLSAFAHGCSAQFVCTPAERMEQGRGALGEQDGWPDELESTIATARRHRPDFFYLYFDALARTAERHGPDSRELSHARAAVDEHLGKLADGFADAYRHLRPLWLITGGYAVSAVNHVAFPNRVLREAGLLALRQTPDGTAIDFQQSWAWALADRQAAHVFVAERDASLIRRVAELFDKQPGIAQALDAAQLQRYELDHARTGDVVLVSASDSWQASTWLQPGEEPSPARSRIAATPLDVEQVKGSHGAPAADDSQRSVVLSSEPGVLAGRLLADTDLCDLTLRQFGI